MAPQGERPALTGVTARAERAPRFERSARFWLRAYPRRWRRERADEVIAVLAELASAAEAGQGREAGAGAAGGASRPIGARAALDLVRHGWATRWREHPPLHRWLAYRFFDVGLPRRYRGWVADDIDGALYLQRMFASFWVIGLAVLLVDGPASRIGWWWILVPQVYQLVPPFIRFRRGRARERHLVAEPGEPLVRGTYVAMGEPRRRVPTTWAVPRALALDLGALGSALVAALLAPTTLVSRPAETGGFEVDLGPSGATTRWLALGLLAAVLAASYAWNRRARTALAARLADLPAQPDRVVESPGRGRDVALVLVLAAVVAWSAGEVAGAWALSLSPLAGAFAAMHLPRTLAIASAARRLGHRAPDGSPLTWADLDKVAATRTPPPPDTLQRVVRRWDGPTVPGQLVLGPRPPAPISPDNDPYRLA